MTAIRTELKRMTATPSASGTALSFYAPLTTSIMPNKGTIVGFSRASTAYVPVYDESGVDLYKLAQSGEARFWGARRVENLLQGSDFGASLPTDWITSGGATYSNNLLTSPGEAAGARVNNAIGITFNGTNVVYSVTLKAGTSTSAVLLLYDSTAAAVRVTTTVTLTSTQRRYSTSYNSWIPGNNLRAYIYVTNTSGGSAGDSIYVYNAQIEDVTGQTNKNPSEYVSIGVLSSPYHGTGADGVKYFATQNGNTVASNIVTEATGAALSSSQLKMYLAEYARTNLALQSETFDNASWSKNQSTITADAITAPNGYTTADKLVEDATAASEHRISQGGFTAAQHTFSIYAKAGERTRIRLMNFNATDSTRAAVFNLSGGTVVSVSGSGATAAIRSIGNGWYRCILTCTSTATTAVYVNLVTGTATVSYDGDGTSGVYIWGAQMEAAGFASTYIPTTTASVARPADVLEYAEPFANFESVGSIYAETVPMHTYTEIQLSTWRGRVVGAGTGSDSFINFNHVNARSEVYDGTNVGFTSANSWQWTRGTKYKLASSWGGASMRIALSGTAGSDATFTGTMDASATTFRVGTAGSEATTGFCGIGNVKIYKKAYPGTRLATMTA